VSYPGDYHRKQFAGKRIHYQIQIKEVKEKHLAELNDEFASELGAKDLEALKRQIKDDLVTKAQRDAEKKAKEAVLDDIVKRHSFDVPDCLIQDEMAEHTRRIARDLAMRGVNIERASIDWRKVREEGRPFAEQAVRRSLILDAVAKLENIEVSEAELEEEIQKHAATSGKSPAALRAQLEKDHKIGSLTEHLRQNKALDFIYRNANISQG
jgi:trigger factor